MRKPLIVSILDLSWDDNGKTAVANPNYLSTAPQCLRVSPGSEVGRWLYGLVGHENVLVAPTCKPLDLADLIEARQLAEALNQLAFRTLLVCGVVAQDNYERVLMYPGEYRTVYLPGPEENWGSRDVTFASRIVQLGVNDLHLRFVGNWLRAKALPSL